MVERGTLSVDTVVFGENNKRCQSVKWVSLFELGAKSGIR